MPENESTDEIVTVEALFDRLRLEHPDVQLDELEVNPKFTEWLTKNGFER